MTYMIEDPESGLVTRTSLLGGMLGGLVHTGGAVLLWDHLHNSVWEILQSNLSFGLYMILGMFLLGFIPVLFYIGETVISPALVVGVFLVPSAILSWLSGPPRAPNASPSPFALYVLLWVVVLALAGFIGKFEYRRKRQTVG